MMFSCTGIRPVRLRPLEGRPMTLLRLNPDFTWTKVEVYSV